MGGRYAWPSFGKREVDKTGFSPASVRFGHRQCAKLVDSRTAGQRHIQTVPSRAAIDRTKHVTFPSGEKHSRLVGVRREHRAMTSVRIGKPSANLTPWRIRDAMINVRLRRFVKVRMARGGSR